MKHLIFRYTVHNRKNHLFGKFVLIPFFLACPVYINLYLKAIETDQYVYHFWNYGIFGAISILVGFAYYRLTTSPAKKAGWVVSFYQDQVIVRTPKRRIIYPISKDAVFYLYGVAVYARLPSGKYISFPLVCDLAQFRQKLVNANFRVSRSPIPPIIYAFLLSLVVCSQIGIDKKGGDNFFWLLIAFVIIAFCLFFTRGEQVPKTNRLFSAIQFRWRVQQAFILPVILGAYFMNTPILSVQDKKFELAQQNFKHEQSQANLNELVDSAEQAGRSYHLNYAAWALTTVQDKALRDYAKAVKLGTASIKLKVNFANIDTLSCALMGKDGKEVAIKYAEKNLIYNRLNLFKQNKLCESGSPRPKREIASEK